MDLNTDTGGPLTDDDLGPAPDDPVGTLQDAAPVARLAAERLTVEEGQLVTLDASATTDPNDDLLTFLWSQIGAGPRVTLVDDRSAVLQFTAPYVPATESLSFRLVVQDGTFAIDATAVVTVVDVGADPVQDPDPGQDQTDAKPAPPAADSGPDQTVAVGDTVILLGTVAGDGDLTVTWVQVSGRLVQLNPEGDNASFEAPAVAPPSEDLVFELTVAAGDQADTDDVTITVEAPEQPVPDGSAPIPPAGPDCTADDDGDGSNNCDDECPQDAAKISQGVCGCGQPDTDDDADTVPNCNDQCAGFDDLLDADGDGTPDDCEECAVDADCDDGAYCNGAETCSAGGDCVVPTAPCPAQLCDEATDTCADCAADADCSDGLACTVDTCNSGSCDHAPSCPAGQVCRLASGSCEVLSASDLPIATGAVWQYTKGTAEPPTTWTALSFDDTAWPAGASPLGYEDCAPATVLSDMRNGYTSVYVRRLFNVADPSVIQSLALELDYDDSFVAYINGTEVARNNVNGTPPQHDALAVTNHECSGGDGTTNPAETFVISDSFDLNTLLNTGVNVLAIQGHNLTLGSSDFILIPVLSACTTTCDDGLFCNGTESCVAGQCTAGVTPCSGQQCNESSDTCTDCNNDADCDDGAFCNGPETCVGGSCTAGTAPCAGQMCNENNDTCVDCLGDADCADGVFCNGSETCSSGSCSAGSAPCSGQQCDEAGDGCVDCLNDGHCDDGAYCNGSESCSGGNCQAGSAPCGGACDEVGDTCVGCATNGDCDDSVSCTVDTCESGSCVNRPNNCAWPGGAENTRIDITESDMGGNMSGAVWNPVTEKLWVVSNSGIFWRMSCTGNCSLAGSWSVDGSGSAKWSIGSDTEAITQASWNDDSVFIGIEQSGGNRLIREYDVSGALGTISLQDTWTLTEMNTGATNSGLEALTFVPDAWLATHQFRDAGGNLYTSSVFGTGGLFFAGLQANAHVFVFDLDRSTPGNYIFVGEFTTGQSEIAGLEFDRSNGLLYSYHNYGNSSGGGSNDKLQALDITASGSGVRQLPSRGMWLGPRVHNNEGLALLPNDDCDTGSNRFFFLVTDDAGTSNSVGIYDLFPCDCNADIIDDADETDTDGDGIIDVCE